MTGTGLRIFLLIAGLAIWKPVPSIADKVDDMQAAVLKSIVTDSTILTHDRFFGTQVEFNCSNGDSFLWFPGNEGVVKALWKTQLRDNGATEICYLYGTDTKNYVTEETGGKWECRSAVFHLDTIREAVDGDPFGLSSLNVPFVMPERKKLSLAELAELADLDRGSLDYVKSEGKKQSLTRLYEDHVVSSDRKPMLPGCKEKPVS